jgi:hypothetical protein
VKDIESGLQAGKQELRVWKACPALHAAPWIRVGDRTAAEWQTWLQIQGKQ